jgi:uncharacterized protein YjbI with pentapeptide repeats
MANEKHLNLLKKGVAPWNTWRKKGPEIRPDLRGANLIGKDLHDANLSGANFTGADLSMANLRRVDLH